MSIEYVCGCGRQYPLAELYWSDTCKKIVCPWPTCSLQEIDSYFCRFQMDNLPSKEAAAYKNRSARTFACPDCRSTLQTIKHDKYTFFCAHCRWDSDSIQLTDEDPDTLMMVANTREREEHVFDVLLAHYQQRAAAQTSIQHTRSFMSKRSFTSASSSRFIKYSQRPPPAMQLGWKMENLDAKLKDTLSTVSSAVDTALVEQCRQKFPHHESFHGIDAVRAAQCDDMAAVSTLAQRNLCTPLLQSRDVSALCVESMASGAPGILVKPQINPMTGDSSMVVGASWWKKATLALHMLPSVTIRRVWEPKDAAIVVAWLLVENPLDEDIVLVLTQDGHGDVMMPSAPIRVGGYEDPNLIDTTGADILQFIGTVRPWNDIVSDKGTYWVDMTQAASAAVLVSRNYAKIKLETSVEMAPRCVHVNIAMYDAASSPSTLDVATMPLLSRFAVVVNIPAKAAAATKATDVKKRKWQLQTYLDRRDFQGAMTLLRFQAKHGEGSRLNTLWTAYCLFHMGEYVQALEHYEQVLAADIYKRVLARHETHAAINVYLAMCYYHLEYFDISSELLATYLATSDGHSNVAKNLLACNTFHLVDGVAAEKSLQLHLPQPVGHALVEHNVVVFRQGDVGLRLWPPLLGTVPEAKLNLALFHIKHDTFEKAFDLLDTFEPAQPIAYILK
ncbi:hypothetical protein B5M09_007381, partial [Aphanomyces astaci]